MSQDFEYVTISPGDVFSVGSSPDGEPGIRIEQTAFVETDRWLTFGDGADDVRRMRDNLNRITKSVHTVGVTTAADLVETKRELEALDAVDKKLLDLIQAALFKTGWGAS